MFSRAINTDSHRSEASFTRLKRWRIADWLSNPVPSIKLATPVLLSHLLRGSAWLSLLHSKAILSLHQKLKFLPLLFFSFFKRNKGKYKPAISFTLLHPSHALLQEKSASWPLACSEMQRKTKALFWGPHCLEFFGGLAAGDCHPPFQIPLPLALGRQFASSYFPPPVYSLLSFFSSLPLNSSVRNTCQRCRSGHIVSYNRAVCKECRASGSAHALRLYSLGGCRVPVYYVYISHSWPLGPPVCSQPLWSPLILPCPSLLPYLLTHCFWAEVYHSSGSSLYHYEILIASPVPL